MPSSTISSASQIRHIRPTTAEASSEFQTGEASHTVTDKHERLHFETLAKLSSLPGSHPSHQSQPTTSSSSPHPIRDPTSSHTTSKIFSPQHITAIESLRQAQLALAQTYILSSTTHLPSTTATSTSNTTTSPNPNSSTTNTATSTSNHPLPPAASAALNLEHEAAEKERKGLDEAHQKIFSTSATTSTTTTMGSGGEDGVSVDLQLARRRRAANQRLFERTKELVAQVGERLDTVAVAMRVVERESRGIWDSESERG